MLYNGEEKTWIDCYSAMHDIIIWYHLMFFDINWYHLIWYCLILVRGEWLLTGPEMVFGWAFPTGVMISARLVDATNWDSLSTDPTGFSKSPLSVGQGRFGFGPRFFPFTGITTADGAAGPWCAVSAVVSRATSAVRLRPRRCCEGTLSSIRDWEDSDTCGRTEGGAAATAAGRAQALQRTAVKLLKDDGSFSTRQTWQRRVLRSTNQTENHGEIECPAIFSLKRRHVIRKQSINQPTNPTINQSLKDQSINQSINHSLAQRNEQSINQSINGLIDQQISSASKHWPDGGLTLFSPGFLTSPKMPSRSNESFWSLK